MKSYWVARLQANTGALGTWHWAPCVYLCLGVLVSLCLLILPKVQAAECGDSILHLGATGYASRVNSEFNDLDYSKDFSVEIIINIPPNYGEKIYEPIIAKSYHDSNWAKYPGWALVSYGQFNNYGKQIQVSIKDGTEMIRFQSGGIAGNNYITLTWDATTKNATLYINGEYEDSQANSNITPLNIKEASSSFMIGWMSDYPSGWEFKRDVMMARLWNRKLSLTEISGLWDNYDSNNQHTLPTGFDTTELLSEWLMQESSDANGSLGTTHIKDSFGDNHLELFGGAELQKANGLITLVYPLNGATGIDKNPTLEVNGGIAELGSSITRPIHYYFEIDEVPTFDSPALQTSGRYQNYTFVADWIPYYGKFKPTLKPDTAYYWRVKVRDSSVTPVESGWSTVYSFTTEGSQNWYVRPHNTGITYGAEDGTSYENAWNSLKNIEWGAQGVEAGDTLFICGPQLRQLSSGSYEYGSSFNYMTSSGYSDEYPITITTNCPGHPGKVWGYTNRTGAVSINWNGPDGNNIYNTTGINIGVGSLLAQDINGLNAIALKEASGPDLGGQFGAYYYDSGSGVTYVRLTDGGNPTYRVFDQYGPFSIDTNGQSYIKFENYNSQGLGINILGKSSGQHSGSQLLGITDPKRPVSTNITFDKCNFSYVRGTCLSLKDGNDYITIKNSHFSNLGNGIYLSTYYEPGAEYVLIENNTFQNIGVFSSGGDAHAIGVQNGNNWTIQHNYMENTGEAITFFGWGNMSMSDMTVRYNFIKNATAHTTSGSGIVFSGSRSNIAVGSRLNNLIYGNIVLNAEDYCYSSNHRDVSYWYNNVCYNCTLGFRFDSPWEGAGPNPVMYNNIVVNPSDAYIFANGPSGGAWDITSDYNLFYKESGTARGFVVQGKGISTTDLTTFQSYGYDTHSLMADPQFVVSNPLTAADFKLQAGSPAIDAGVDVGLTQDFEGNSIPQGAAPDIGAYEYVPETGTMLYGDVSGDSEVSAYDAALAAQAAVVLITLTAEQTKAADVNGDSEVTAYDAALIAQYAVGLISKFPVEFT